MPGIPGRGRFLTNQAGRALVLAVTLAVFIQGWGASTLAQEAGAGPGAAQTVAVDGGSPQPAPASARNYVLPAPSLDPDSPAIANHSEHTTLPYAQRQPLAVYNRTTGDHKALALLVDFQDITHAAANSQSKYDVFFNANSSTNRSLRTFYWEDSGGNYTVNVTVVDWVTMPQNMAYYSTSSGEDKIAVDAAQAADSSVDFSLFDEDGDGYVDNLLVLHAGNDQAVTGNSSEIWSFMGTGNTVTVDGKTVRSFATVAEDITDGDPLGVVCHEFGHLAFGLPDLYDLDGNNAGLGDWDLMATGGWGGGGLQPNHLSAWSKLSLGWIAPFEPSASQDNYTIYPMTNLSIRNPVKIASNYSNEYFLIEFRWRNTSLRFDRYVPTSGLVIYHVDETTISANLSNNRVETNTAHKGIDIEEVGTQDMDASASNTGSSNDVWVNNTTGFTPTSTPNSNLYRNNSSYATGIRVSNISAVNLTGGPHITFSIDTGRGNSGLTGAVLNNSSAQTVQPGATANFTVQFTTASATGDNLTISAEGSFGLASVTLNRTNLTLGALASGNVTLSVTLPANCTAGTYVDVGVRGNSTGQPSVTFVVSTRTTCAQVYAANLSGPAALNATVGQMLGQNYTVANAGNGWDFFALNVTFNASLINISLNVTGFNILPGLNATFRLNFTVASSVPDGTVIPFSINASYGSAGALRIYLNGTLTARSAAISGLVVGNNSTQTAQPGVPAIFTVQFTTASAGGDNLTLSVEGAFGSATVSLNRSSLVLGGLGSGTVNLSVTLTSSCLAGSYLDVTLRANSTVQSGATAAVATRTICAQVHAANVSGPAAFNASLGRQVSQNYTLSNTGNGADNFIFSAVYNASLINITVTSATLPVGTGANLLVQVNFTVPTSVADLTAISFTIDAAFGPSGAIHARLNGSVTARGFPITGTALNNSSVQTVEPGVQATFAIQFTTGSIVGDTLTIAAEGTFGNATVTLNRTSLVLAAMGSGAVTLSVTLPALCSLGSALDVTVRSNSTNVSGATFGVLTRTICGQAYLGNWTGSSGFDSPSGGTSSQNFTLRNGGNGPDNFTLAMSYNASLLSMSGPAQTFSLAAGASVTVQINFSVASSVADGAVLSFSLAASHGPSGGRHAVFNGSVVARSFTITGTVLNNSSVQSAQPGASAVFTVEFATASSVGDTLQLSAEGAWGNATVGLSRASLALSGLGSGTVDLTVTLPASCAAGSAVDVSVRANSTGLPLSTRVVSTRTVCGQAFGGNITGADAFGGRAGVRVSQNYTVRNSGNGADNYTLIAAFNGSLINISGPTQAYALAPGGSATVQLNFTVQGSVPDGTLIPFSLEVAFGPSFARRSQLNGTVTVSSFALSGAVAGGGSTQEGLPGAAVVFVVQFASASPTGDSVGLSIEGSTGAATATLNRTNITLGPLGAGLVALTVTLPPTCQASEAFSLTVRANSSSDPLSFALVPTVALCAHAFGAQLTGPSAFTALPSVPSLQDFTLTNSGNGPDTLTFSAAADPALLGIAVATPAVALSAGGSAVFEVAFTLAASVLDGQVIPFALDVAFGPSGSRHAFLNGTVTAGRFSALTLTVDAIGDASLDAGVPRRFNLTIGNGGNYLASVSLSSSAPPGFTALLDTASVQVSPFSSAVVGLTLTADAGALAGLRGDVLLSVATPTPPAQASTSVSVVVAQRFGVELTGPTSTSAPVGALASVELTASNLGNGPDGVTFEVAPSGAPWQATVVPGSATLDATGAGRILTVRLEAIVPANAAAGSTQTFDVTLRSQSAGVASSIRITIIALADVTFTVTFDGPHQPVAPAGTATFEVGVRNTGNVQAEFAVTAEGLDAGWTAANAPSGAFTLSAGAYGIAWVNVTLPANATAGIHNFRIQVSNPADVLQSASLAVSIEVAVTRAISIEVPALPGTWLPGASLEVNVTVRNLGNAEETVVLTAAGSVDHASFFPALVTLAPFGESVVTFRFAIRPDEPAGQIVVNMTARSALNSSVSDLGTLFVQVGAANQPPSGEPPAHEPTPNGNLPALTVVLIAAVAGMAIAAAAWRRRAARRL